jgi:hypothetical protein
MTKKQLTLIKVALGLVLFGFVILALQLLIIKPTQERARARPCYSHLVEIFIASRTYAREHGTRYQTNLICLSNELISPSVLLCVDDNLRRQRVSDKARAKGFVGYGSAEHWARLRMEDCSYEVFLRDSNTLVIRCPIHKIGAYTDGEMDKNGSWIEWERNRK